jgi:fructosamine-3-kinase
MPVQESDISWQVLRRIVHNWAGAAAELVEVRPLAGGAINTTLSLTTKDGAKAVLKISPHRVDRDLLREAGQLTLFKTLGVPAPEVFAWQLATLDEPHSYLLLEFIEGIDLAAARRQCTPQQFDDLQNHLAEIVLHMHSNTADAYHRAHAHDSQHFTSWPEFYKHVYDPIWHEIEKSPAITPKMRKQIARIHQRLDVLLANDDCPRLVHSDLWSTNIMARPDPTGRWRIAALLDPNCKYAHSEAEIAYLELFNTITPTFLKTYQRDRKLPDAYHQRRKPIYQLYPLINHVRLFGNAYVKPLTAALERAAGLK